MDAKSQLWPLIVERTEESLEEGLGRPDLVRVALAVGKEQQRCEFKVHVILPEDSLRIGEREAMHASQGH